MSAFVTLSTVKEAFASGCLTGPKLGIREYFIHFIGIYRDGIKIIYPYSLVTTGKFSCRRVRQTATSVME